MLVVGLLIIAAGIVLLFNVLGAGDLVVRHVTSRSLGELAPGYAASPGGFKVYAILVQQVGLAVVGLALTDQSELVGLALLFLGCAGFIAWSVVAIRGEVRIYRALKR
jgi:hypothetical protein